MTDVHGRTAFVTGGANGIGLGIARSFARAGAKLALVDVDGAALPRAKAELQNITPVETYQLDVRDREEFATTAAAVERDLGPVSLLFNNAGIVGGASAADLTYDLWDWNIGINLGGVINGIQTFVSKMVERGEGGHIVNTSSGAGLVATGSGVLYTTAKFGVVGLTESIRPELAPAGIGVSVLCPGPVATDIIQRSGVATPKTLAPLAGESNTHSAQRIAEAIEYLKQGVSIDDVGEMVLKAVQDNVLYIHTDRAAVELIKARTVALLNAMPN